MENKEVFWLDCDPGHDDFMAIILGSMSGAEFLGISTTSGNQSLAKTTKNAQRTLALVGRTDIPVVAGLSKPLINPARECPEIHGSTGLDLPHGEQYDVLRRKFESLEVAPTLHENGIVAMRNRICSRKNVNLIATGCLTNVAAALTVFPEIAGHLKQIVFLGGAVGDPAGNIDPCAEFNVLLDPHAAQIVFHSGVKVVMISLLVTHKALITNEVLQKFPSGTDFSSLVVALMSFFKSTYKNVFDMDYPPLHDPLAVAYCLDESIFKTKLLNVEVELSSPLCQGQTVVKTTGRTPNVHVALDVQIGRFWDLMVDAVKRANEKSNF